MPYRLSLIALAATILSFALPAAAPAAARDVTVMTRNLYLGSDVINLATSPDVPTLARSIKAYWEMTQNNDFTVRSKALAAEVKRYRPDVIGLQEAAMWRRGPDGVQDNDVNRLNSTQVLYDYLKIYMQDLRAAGLRYKLARVTTEMDVEGPHADGYDIRLTQRDAVLVRVGRGAPKVLRTRGGNFTAQFVAPTVIGPARVTRGYQAVDLRKGGREFTFANVHSEAYSPDINEAQMKELLRKGVPSKRKPTILVGDINSDPTGVGTSDARGTERLPKAYRVVVGGGFVNQLPRRITSGYGENLRLNDPSKLDEWLDHIFSRPKMKLLSSTVTGTKMVNGLWPSDHRGVVAKFRLP